MTEKLYARCNRSIEVIGSYASGTERKVEIFKDHIYEMVDRKSSGAFFEHDEHEGCRFYLFHNEYSVLEYDKKPEPPKFVPGAAGLMDKDQRRMLADPEYRKAVMGGGNA